MRASVSSAILGVAIGVILVLAISISAHPGWGFLSHADCEVNQEVGNLTVWMPAAVVAAPYLGSEEGSVAIWGTSHVGTSTLTQETTVAGGNVTAYYVSFANVTVFSLANVTTTGPGPESHCSGGLVAYFSPNPSQGLRSGGVTLWPIASELKTDSGIAPGLNASQLCNEVENTSYNGCAVGAQFDVNFDRATGTVDTCGSSQDQVIRDHSQAWPVTTPYHHDGQTTLIPIDPAGTNSPGYANGTYAWYNYTFPANGGIWQYDDLAQTSSTGAGLVFSYSPCP